MATKVVTYTHVGGRPATLGDARRYRARGRAMTDRGVVHALDAGEAHGVFSGFKGGIDYTQKKHVALCGEVVLSMYSDGYEDYPSPICEAVGQSGAGVTCKRCRKVLASK